MPVDVSEDVIVEDMVLVIDEVTVDVGVLD